MIIRIDLSCVQTVLGWVQQNPPFAIVAGVFLWYALMVPMARYWVRDYNNWWIQDSAKPTAVDVMCVWLFSPIFIPVAYAAMIIKYPLQLIYKVVVPKEFR